ncbi:MAG: TetR/AcrR family transcriptional regulator [Deltaproteobacteria bacterium]|nr:TetR/AcrR family transcriptional regulator [Deltaproteobacteria bacterium]
MLETVSKSNSERPLKRKGRATRAAILDAAHEVFKSTGYYGSSISEITRRCGFSMGTFYNYFKNKEQVFLALNDEIVSRFRKRIEASPPTDLKFEERLRRVVRLLLDHTRDNFAFHRILGESELIDGVTIAYYDAITQYYRDFFHREAQSGNIHPLDPDLLAYGLTGVCYFHSLDWGTGESPDQDALVDGITDLVINGISGSKQWNIPKEQDIFSLPAPVPLHTDDHAPLTKGEKTRQFILNAAEKVIGRHGINRASISEITREAGVAQGTFYIHFSSKSDLLEEFVRYINHEMRREIQRFVAGVGDRRDAERVGMRVFFRFIRQHRQIYRVVPECEMISRGVALWYYQTLAKGYVEGLKEGIRRGDIRDIPAPFAARSLMGLIHFVGLKKIIWSPDPEADMDRRLFGDLTRFVLFGLKGSRAGVDFSVDT